MTHAVNDLYLHIHMRPVVRMSRKHMVLLHMYVYSRHGLGSRGLGGVGTIANKNTLFVMLVGHAT